MASVKLLLRGKKNPSNLTLRFTNGRNMDLWSKTNLLINPDHWDQKNQQLRNLIAVTNRGAVNSTLSKLKLFVIDKFNEAYALGESIDSNWLDDTVALYFNRPKQEANNKIESHFVYYYDFVIWWLETQAKSWRTSKNVFLEDKAIAQYNSFLKIFERFQGNKKVRIKNVDIDYINSFITYMEDIEGYAPYTVKRHVGRLRFFINRAIKYDIKIDSSFNERVFVSKSKEDVSEPYLNEQEINRIYNLDLSHDDTLDNVRDNFIIGLWTGLRISDFNNNLDITNINDDYIEIKTKKTGAWVAIPLHKQVKAILNKRYNNLPRKISDQKFNKGVKHICLMCNIDEDMKGKLFDAKTKRKITGVYPKYKLISSHICRRSFATNLFGKVPNNVIMAVAGWKKESMFLHYIKKTKRESAEILKKHWDE